jgi:ABC-type dipeptide/oligopeptide/nickel transport system permease component
LFLVIPILLGVSVLVFLLLHLSGGNPAVLMAGPDAPPETIAAIERMLGLDQPLYVQYGRYVLNVVQGDLGTSIRSRSPVAAEVGRTLPVTLQLTLLAVLYAVTMGIPLGVLSAVFRDKVIDRLAMFVALLGITMPVFAIGILLILIFSIRLEWTPISGYVPLNRAAGLHHFVLPMITAGSATMALIARVTRSSLLEVLEQDYVRTARAKGLSSPVVVTKHALRNALVPVVTIVGVQFGGLMGGAVVTETIFALPGLGRLILQSIQTRDFPLVQGSILVAALIFVIVNLLTDAVYAVIDPRIRYA